MGDRNKSKPNLDDSGDLTRIENLSDFDHVEDTKINRLFDLQSDLQDESDCQPEDEAPLDDTSLEENDANTFSPEEEPDFEPLFEGPETLNEEISDFSLSDNNFFNNNSNDNLNGTNQSSLPEMLSQDLKPKTQAEKTPTKTSIHAKNFLSHARQSPPSSEKTQLSSKRPPPVTFDDLRRFGENISSGTVSAGGNPPFALIIKNIKYIEDAEDILRILRDVKLITADNEETISTGLQHGCALISQISEYAAIHLAHRFRQYDVDIEFGLAEVLFKPKGYDDHPRGLINKNNLFQNHTESLNIKSKAVRPESIILTTTSTLAGYNILKYLNIIIEHAIVGEEKLTQLTDENKNIESDFMSTDLLSNKTIDDDDLLIQKYQSNINDVYQDLVEKMRLQACKIGGNAIVGLNFQIQALPSMQAKEEATHLLSGLISTTENFYKITCTGNVVIISDGI